MLNTQSPFGGAVLGGLEGVALLEEVSLGESSSFKTTLIARLLSLVTGWDLRSELSVVLKLIYIDSL